ncbi:MAG TPA: DNA cytosine methyltransferase [Bacteroidetes bacterium]|nr:DNA cytosine methyltransferase [Bacteroidota bacterium]
MATVKYYLDKVGKSGLAPVHLRVHCSGKQVKLSTGIKVRPENFNKASYYISPYEKNAARNNAFLAFLMEKSLELFNNPKKKIFTVSEAKSQLKKIIDSYKEDQKLELVREEGLPYKRTVNFIDFFAGAGGISEGFLQAETEDKKYGFLLASDINDNCELTHVVYPQLY